MNIRSLVLVILIFTVSSPASLGFSINDDPQFMLKEDLSIGVDYGEEHLMFGFIGGIGLDAQENIYVLDMRNFKIQIFDNNGAYSDTINLTKGQGPQEITMIMNFAVTAEGTIFLLDTGGNKVLVLDQNKEFLNSIKIDFEALNIIPYKEDKVILLGLKHNRILHVYDISGNNINAFGSPLEIPSKLSPFKDSPFVRTPQRINISTDGKIFVLNPHKYEILMYKENKLIQKIQGKNKAYMPFEARKSSSGREMFFWPYASMFEHQDKFYVALRVHDKKRIYQVLDIFKDYKPVESMEVNGFVHAIDGKGRLYMVNQEEYPKVVRYQVIEK
jgi:hypothetical protein